MIERNNLLMEDRSRPPEVATHCPYRGFQRGVSLARTGSRVVVASRPDFPVNRDALGIKEGLRGTDRDTINQGK